MANNLIKVYSNCSSISHQPSNGDMVWRWVENPYEDECYLELDKKLVKDELRKSVGLNRLFERGMLQIKEEGFFNLDEDVKQYIKSKQELEEFIFNSTYEEFDDYLCYAPTAMLDNIETICTAKELTDRRKIKLFKQYTGKDLEEFYEDNNDETVNKDSVGSGKPQGRKPRTKVTEK